MITRKQSLLALLDDIILVFGEDFSHLFLLFGTCLYRHLQLEAMFTFLSGKCTVNWIPETAEFNKLITKAEVLVLHSMVYYHN